MKKFVAAAIAAVVCSASVPAMADLNATNITLSVNHDGLFSGLSAVNDQNYTYGNPGAFVVPNWGTLNVTSPALAPGYDNALMLDFANFGYEAFAALPAVGTVTLKNIAAAPDLSSVKIFVNGVNVGFGVAAAAGGFQASWNTTSVYALSPAFPNVVVAWNSVVPAPGAMALLGLAGVVGVSRRRR